MANNTGMFGQAFKDIQGEDRYEDERLLKMAGMDGIQQANYASLTGAQMAGRGLGNIAATAAGKDTRTPEDRLKSAMTAVGEMEDSDLSTPEGVDGYYKGVIGILRKNGLPGEAHRAAQEWNEYKSKQTDQQLKRDDLNRKAEEAKRKAAGVDEANRIKALRAQQLAAQGTPEFIQIVDRIEKEQNPTVRKLLMDRANQQAGGKVKFEEAGDRIIVRNERGDILGVDEMGEKPMNEKDRLKDAGKKKEVGTAYQSAMMSAQTSYKAAADLYNHPGLDDLIGKWSGLAAERGTDKDGMLREAAIARLSPAGQEALALFQQVEGGAFVRALEDLKKAGGGSTGLGQVTEIEGKKVTAAKAALFPRQQPASFRRKLADYISVIEQSAHILGNAAQTDGLDRIELNIVDLSGPVRGAAPTRAPTTPRAAPRAAPAGDRVKVGRRSTGEEGTISRSAFEADQRRPEAQRRYLEIK